MTYQPNNKADAALDAPFWRKRERRRVYSAYLNSISTDDIVWMINMEFNIQMNNNDVNAIIDLHNRLFL